MSLIGTYRISSVGNSTYSNRILNFTGFKPSGISDGNLLGVALYTYDYARSAWIPMSGGRASW